MVYYYGMMNGNDRDARLLTIFLETGVKGLKLFFANCMAFEISRGAKQLRCIRNSYLLLIPLVCKEIP